MSSSAERVEVSRDRYGYRIGGQFYRRVSTYLGGIPKNWLGNWAAKFVAEYAVEKRESWEKLPTTDAVKLLKGSPWSKRDDAADRGTAVHAVIENLVRGTPLPDMTEDALECAIQAERFLKRLGGKPLATELTVFSPTYGYAGTLDLWLDREPERWIIDWKTSGAVYVEQAVQQVAYLKAEFAVVRKKLAGKPGEERWTGEVIPWSAENTQLGIVHVRPDGAELHPIRREQVERLWTVFRAAKHIKEFLLDTDNYNREPRVAVYCEPVFSEAAK